jgi:thioesterase domain-containing protein
VLPLAILFKAGHIEKLAEVIERRESRPWSPLVPIRPEGMRAPLFCIHPGGGNVLGYNEFIEKLDADLPVYGLQAYGVVEGQEPHDSIPEMARIYLESVREVQPHGPYYLGGESFGGLVAYEMACQLQDAGEKVALLFLGDVWMNASHVQNTFQFKLSRFTYPFTLSWADWKDLFTRKILKRGAPQYVTTKRYTYADDMHRRNSQAHRKANRDFVPRPYAGKVTLFRALEQHHGTRRLQHFYRDAAMNWNHTAAAGTEVHWMPGWHGNMMHDHNALGFARRLQDCIDRAGRSAAT